MLAKQYQAEKTSKGNPQHRAKDNSGTVMLISDLALLGPPFRPFVDQFAKDQNAFFAAFTNAWVKLQENGVESSLRSEL